MNDNQPTISFGGKTYPLDSFNIGIKKYNTESVLATKLKAMTYSCIIPVDPKLLEEIMTKIVPNAPEVKEEETRWKLPLIDISQDRINKILGE